MPLLMKQGSTFWHADFKRAEASWTWWHWKAAYLSSLEVKTRASKEFGDPWEFVDWEKQQNLQSAADEFIARYDLGQYAYRFDVVAVIAPGTQGQEIALYRNAF